MPAESGSESNMERERAPRRLRVCVILTSKTPPAWWHSLLRLIDLHPNIILARILISEPDSPTSDTATNKKTIVPVVPLIDRLTSTIIQDIVNKPQLQQDPLTRSALASCYQSRIELISSDHTGVNPVNATLTQDLVDVVIQSHDVTAPWTTNLPALVWMADLSLLHSRAVAALTERDPFFHINLLHRQPDTASRQAGRADWTILSSHTLPLQTFSITDLETAARACLPSLFIAHLNWLSLGHETCPGWSDDTHLDCVAQPRNTPLLIQALKLLWQQFRQRLRDQLYYEQWQLAFRNDLDIQYSIDDLTKTSMESYRPLLPPDKHSWADPHIVTQEGSLHVFFEAIEVVQNLGWINSARLDQNGFAEPPKKALTSDHHLSYPYTIEHDGQLWMIPETSSEGTVSLYRCTGFPDQWEQVSQLITGLDVADCTLLHRDGRWWLFGNTMTHPTVDERDELRIWFSDELTGPWQPHPLNPVLTGVHHARMAGSFLYSGGELFRPSQFGGWRYGHAINLARVDRLTTEDYHESLVGQIRPTPDTPWLGCHTIAHQNGATLIDRVRRRSRLGHWARARVRGNG